MHVCILQGAFLPIPPRQGGAVEKRWYLLGQKLFEKSCNVTHVSRRWRDLPDSEVLHGVLYKRASGFDMPKSGLWLKLLDLIYTINVIKIIPKDADIIVTNTFWAPILLPLFSRAAIYVDVSRMPKGQMCLYKKAAILRANSSAVLKAIVAELPIRQHHRVSMVPNHLPYDAMHNVDFSAKQNTILFAGRIHPEKGLDLLETTVKFLPKNWNLKIVGPWETYQGGGGSEYLRQLKKRFASDKVVFLEPIFDINVLSQLYQQTKIFVYPSVAEKGETFGLAPLEAMAWGCVPVVSDLDCFKDFINDDVNGLVFNHRVANTPALLNSCMQRLMSDSDLYERLALKALDVRETHSVDAIADMFLKDFKKCMVSKNV